MSNIPPSGRVGGFDMFDITALERLIECNCGKDYQFLCQHDEDPGAMQAEIIMICDCGAVILMNFPVN